MSLKHLLILIIPLAFIILWLTHPPKNTPPLPSSDSTPTSPPTIPIPTPTPNQLSPPLTHASQRATQKTFGQYITPQNSPLQPERFTGFHTGVDFEVFPTETNTDVPVQAICSGPLIFKDSVTGYGGVAIQSCTLEDQPVTIIYGHLNLESIPHQLHTHLQPSDFIGYLGSAFSPQTDGERQHLHLGIHKDTQINLQGYVDTQVQLSNWLNPCNFLCLK